MWSGQTGRRLHGLDGPFSLHIIYWLGEFPFS
jgi:hypothetical protein